MAINVLTPDIYNRISAGEVVEKPASVVKELIENAIDAGATSINIAIMGGGIEQIKISDNGCGIDPSDLRKAFLPHATSKIKNVDDLDSILTLGFRGEALASIASVSQIQMISKTADNDIGKIIALSAGVIEREEDKGCPTGTQITVNNLFYNTPARYKFLKKPKQEESEITNLVSKFILANPEIAFNYSADNKIIYQHSKSDLKQAIYVVYGKECYDALQEVNFKSDKVILSGFIGKPSYVKPNRTYQTLIVNGRYVSNQTISTAVYNAFSGYLMTGKFPFFVLSVNVPTDEIDVNVHPAKMEVKFQNANDIFKAVYIAVKNALNNINTVIDYKVKSDDKDELKFVNEPINLSTLKKDEGVSFSDNIKDSVNIKENEDDKKIDIINNKINKLASSYSSMIHTDNDITLKLSSNPSMLSKIYEEELAELKKEKQVLVQASEQESLFDKNDIINKDIDYKISGKLFNTYLIIEKDNICYLIDQHAAHERLLFDKLYKQTEQGAVIVQQLLMPYLINVNYVENDFLKSKLDNLYNIGFEIEEFGPNTYKVSTVPQLLCDIDLANFFNDILSDINSYKTITNAEIIRDKLATKACKSAVKGGDDLNENEINILINNMMKQSTPYLCPHGRPIIVKITKTELEKMFKRIV